MYRIPEEDPAPTVDFEPVYGRGFSCAIEWDDGNGMHMSCVVCLMDLPTCPRKKRRLIREKTFVLNEGLLGP